MAAESSTLGAIFSATMLAATLRSAVPYASAALGGVWSESSGVVNIGLEGLLLSSALASVVATHATGSALAGGIAAVVISAALALVHALLVVKAKVDAIVSGIAINVVAAGGTRFLLRALYDSSSNSPRLSDAGAGFFGVSGASGGALLLRTLLSPLTLAVIAIACGTAWTMRSTRFGLHVRASGESPMAAKSAGIDVGKVRVLAVTLGGAAAGIGGAALAFDQHQFQSDMSGGRGFIALAAVILSGWSAIGAALACLAFAALDALQGILQGAKSPLPHDLVQALPYVITLLALALVMGRRGNTRRPPAGLGKDVA